MHLSSATKLHFNSFSLCFYSFKNACCPFVKLSISVPNRVCISVPSLHIRSEQVKMHVHEFQRQYKVKCAQGLRRCIEIRYWTV